MAVKFEDYYKTLGVSRDASQDDIKRAYRKLANKFHPDRNKQEGASSKFAKINEAYEVLRDPEKRQKYDALGKDWKAGQDFRPPPGWEHGNYRTGPGGQQFHFHSSGDFSDFFEQLFGAAGGRRGGGRSNFEQMFGGAGGAGPQGFGGAQTAPPREQQVDLTITLTEAAHGSTRSLRLQAPDGEKTLDVKIPKGVTNGSKIRLKEHGILLKLSLASDPRFEVDGHNLTHDVHVMPWIAALGGKVDVQTLEGAVTMTIPAGTNSGRKLRLKGKGLPKRGGGEAGDLFARIMIDTPKNLSDKQRELFEQLRDASE